MLLLGGVFVRRAGDAPRRGGRLGSFLPDGLGLRGGGGEVRCRWPGEERVLGLDVGLDAVLD